MKKLTEQEMILLLQVVDLAIYNSHYNSEKQEKLEIIKEKLLQS